MNILPALEEVKEKIQQAIYREEEELMQLSSAKNATIIGLREAKLFVVDQIRIEQDRATNGPSPLNSRECITREV